MEIEVKILEVDKNAIIKKLKSMGAKLAFEGDMSVEFFDFEGDVLARDKKILRLRQKGEKYELTFKQLVSKASAKIMEEHEISSKDGAVIKKMLLGLGLKKIGSYTKHRVSFKLNGASFELDTYPRIPTFLEIEAPTIEDIKKYIKLLRLSEDDAKPWSGADIFKHYNLPTITKFY